MSFQLHNTFSESVIENIVYTYISRITSLTGPTGPVANNGILTSDGVLHQSIYPYADNILDLGSTNYNFNEIYTHILYIDGIPIESTNGVINLPAGTLIGGVVIGTIRILGKLNNPSELPPSGTSGDSYLI